jgi:alpha-N-acetylglucosamine transferase
VSSHPTPTRLPLPACPCSFNKLRVFNMTAYHKLLWMDADTLALKNIDHLMREPMFTGAFTVDCCNCALGMELRGEHHSIAVLLHACMRKQRLQTIRVIMHQHHGTGRFYRPSVLVQSMTTTRHLTPSSSFTCAANAPAKPSGGLWVVEPSIEIANELHRLIEGPVPGTTLGWSWGDM